MRLCCAVALRLAFAALPAAACSPLHLVGEATVAGLDDEELCGRRSNLLNGALMLFDFRVPEGRDLAALALAGVLGGAGHLGLMAAMRLAPANRVAPVQYSQIVWAVILGTLFFAERPDGIALSGIALVAACGLFTFLREERVGRAAALPRERV